MTPRAAQDIAQEHALLEIAIKGSKWLGTGPVCASCEVEGAPRLESCFKESTAVEIRVPFRLARVGEFSFGPEFDNAKTCATGPLPGSTPQKQVLTTSFTSYAKMLPDDGSRLSFSSVDTPIFPFTFV